jgi:hypothetical protein
MSLAGAVALFGLFAGDKQPAPGPQTAAFNSSASESSHSDNPAHARMSALSADRQAAALGQVVGEGCVGSTAFFQGFSQAGEAFWNVRCNNGRAYAVKINPDASGSTNVLECEVLKSLGTECFKKFD